MKQALYTGNAILRQYGETINSVHIHDQHELTDVYLEDVGKANKYIGDNAYYIDTAFIQGEVLSVLVY